LSFAEQEEMKREKLNRSGNFGTKAQAKQLVGDIADRAFTYEQDKAGNDIEKYGAYGEEDPEDWGKNKFTKYKDVNNKNLDISSRDYAPDSLDVGLIHIENAADKIYRNGDVRGAVRREVASRENKGSFDERKGFADELKSDFMAGNVDVDTLYEVGKNLGGSQESLQKIVDERDIARQRALDRQKSLDNAAALKEIDRKKKNQQIIDEAYASGRLKR